jgi:hypothetical protein
MSVSTSYIVFYAIQDVQNQLKAVEIYEHMFAILCEQQSTINVQRGRHQSNAGSESVMANKWRNKVTEFAAQLCAVLSRYRERVSLFTASEKVQ